MRKHALFYSVISLAALSFSIHSAYGQTQLTKLYDDPRIVAWSADFLAGKRTEVLSAVEADLRSEAPHQFSPLVWCFLQNSIGDLSKAWTELKDPRIRRALGEMPRIYLLYKDGEYKQILAEYPLEKAASIKDIHALNQLVYAAIAENRQEESLQYAILLARVRSDDFRLAWNAARDLLWDERTKPKVEKLVGPGGEWNKTLLGNFVQEILKKMPSTDHEEERLPALEAWLKERPKDSYALQRKGEVLAAMEKLEDASQAYTAAHTAFPFFADTVISRHAPKLVKLSRFNELRQLVSQRALLVSKDAIAAKAHEAFLYASALNDAGQRDAARESLIEAEKQGIKDARLSRLRARIEINSDELREAIIYAREAMELSSRKRNYYETLLEAYRRANLHDDGWKLFQEYDQKFTQKDSDIYHEASYILSNSGQREERVKLCRLAVAEYPGSAWMHQELADALAKAGREPEAISELRGSFNLQYPTSWALRRYTGLIKKSNGTQEAIAELAKLVERFPWLDKLRNSSAPPVSIPETKPKPQPPSTQAMLVTQLGHANSVTSLAISSDQRLAATASRDGTARLWETSSGRELRTFDAHSEGVNAVTFSLDGSTVVTGGRDKKVLMWDTVTGALKGEIGFPAPVLTVAFSPDGRFLLIGGNSPVALLWDLEAKKVVRKFENHAGSVNVVAFSRDGRFILTGTSSTAYLWETASGTRLQDYAAGGEVTSVAFSPDNCFVITGNGATKATLWDTGAGVELQTYGNGKSAVTAVAFSADGKHVLAGDKRGELTLADTINGTEFSRFAGHKSEIKALVVSKDGKLVLSGGADGATRILDFETGKEVAKLMGRASNVFTVAYAPKGNFFVTGGTDRTARLWDAAAGRGIQSFVGHTGAITSITFSADENFIATGSDDNTARVWDTRTGKQTQIFSEHAGAVMSVKFSPNGKHLLTVSRDLTVHLWDISSGKRIVQFIGGEDWHNIAAFSPSGNLLLTVGIDRTARLWNTADGSAANAFTYGDDISSVAYSPDEKVLATGGEQSLVYLWNAETGKMLTPPLTGHLGNINALTFSADGKTLLSGSSNSPVRHWSAVTGELLREFPAESRGVDFIRFSPDGQYVVTGGLDNVTRLLEAATGKQIQTYGSTPGYAPAVAFTPDGKNLLVGSRDASVKVVALAPSNPETDTDTFGVGAVVCRFISFGEGTWAVVDDKGRYDASYQGLVDGLHWVVGNEPVSLEQLKDRYWEPDLLAKVLGFKRAKRKDISTLKDVFLYPQADFSPPAPGTSKMTINLKNQGGGIGAVQVFLNDRLIIEDARGKDFNPNAAQASVEVDLTSPNFDPNGKNEVRVVTFSEANKFLKSRGASVFWLSGSDTKAVKPNFYAIIGGISSYSSPDLQLSFAAKDAVDMAEAIKISANKLFGADKVHITLLTTADVPNRRQPTKAEFKKAFEQLRSAQPSDIIFVYLAGHGLALPGKDGGKERYFYLTQEATTTDKSRLVNDAALLDQTMLSSQELMDWTDPKLVRANKQAMVLDTCAAGALVKLNLPRVVTDEQKYAIERMKDISGIHILMGSAADSFSYEASQYGQGLLTYALLEGMRGGGLRGGIYVDVKSIFQYAENRVPGLARDIRGIQQPLNASRGAAASFDIGWVASEDRALIPLANVKPVIVPPEVSGLSFDDDLPIGLELRKRLRASSYAVGNREKEKLLNSFIYIADEEFPGGILPRIRYAVSGETVTVQIALKKNGAAMGERFEVVGQKNDLQGLAGKIIEAILARAKQSSLIAAEE